MLTLVLQKIENPELISLVLIPPIALADRVIPLISNFVIGKIDEVQEFPISEEIKQEVESIVKCLGFVIPVCGIVFSILPSIYQTPEFVSEVSRKAGEAFLIVGVAKLFAEAYKHREQLFR